MKKLLLLLVVTITTAFALPAIAQEICDNGIDDDFDGFLDCYDPDCANHTWCEGFYIGNDVLCEAVPSQFPEFRMDLDFASRNETTNHIGRMAIGDIDRDGIPEIITLNKYTDELIILEGNDPNNDKINEVKVRRTVGFEPNWEVAIGNLDNDNCAELFFQGTEGSSLYMYAYDCNLNQVWRTLIRSATSRRPGEALDAITYGLADFDGDGKVELYVKDMILDAHTGTIIIGSAATSDNEWNNLNGGPTAVDILGDADLELILGCSIFDINVGTRTANSGTRTLLQSLPEYEIKHPYNSTSVADYNLDGDLDIIASGAEDDGNGNLVTTVFMWDVNHNIVRKYSEKIPGTFTILGCPNPYNQAAYQYGWINGTGRINIGDLDGDGQLNLSYVSGKYLYALDENLNLLWRKDVKEETSGWTGCTLFDFNGDGSSEIVYRDEQYIYIINGTDGTEYPRQPCISRTQREYPIVADVDADGYTELCVTCGFDDVAAVNNFCDLNYSRYSHIRVYKSAAEPWVPARRLWNQHGYFNVNVNDDLTIPRRQQKHHLVWSVGNCTQGPNRPLNNFLNQSPFLNSQGCPTYAAPNLAYVDNSLSVNPPTCPDGNFTVSFQIQNLGDISLSGDVPITFYNGNPTLVGATKLNTISVTLNSFDPGDIHSVTNATVNGPGSNFTLYIVLNDGGTTVPTPISLPNTNFIECDYSDNIISAPVVPLPVTITALNVKDNVKCTGSTSPDNGAVRAFIPVGGAENITDYNFYWSIGPAAKPVASADHVGATYNNIAEGTYTVYAIHKTANCNSDTASVIVNRIDGNVQVEIQLISAVTDCKKPNGHLDALVPKAGSPGQYEPFGKYNFTWYEGNDIFTSPQVSPTHSATDLKPVTYTVLVVEKATGCQTIASYDVPDQSVKPVVDVVKTDLLCTNSTSGSASASIAGVVSGYSFEWYNGNTVKPSPDHTAANYPNIPAGNYTVVATDQSTKCSSDPVTITIVQTIPPVVTASATSNQTSCDPTLPNGAVTSNVGGITTGYSFEWFRGQNTLPANRIATTNTASGLAAGTYTVKATDNVTGCFDTEEVTVANNVVTPSLIVGAIATTTNCSNPNGSITVNPSFDTPGDYTFSWYIGTAVKATPDFATTTNILSGLTPGDYTVRAVHNTRNCTTAPVTATVGDGAPPISIILDNIITQLPSDCNANDGTMKIDLSAPGNVGGFDVSWYVGHEPFANPPFFQQSGVTSSTATNLSAGLYSIVAVNRDNGCSNTETFDLPFADAHRLVLVDKTDVDKCSPLDIGRIRVNLFPTPLPGFNEADYDIHLYEGSEDLGFNTGDPTGGKFLQNIPGVAGTTLYTTINNLEPGFYTLVAISKNPLLTLNCRSVPVVVEIEQIVDYPIIVATQIDANTNCAGIMANGQIEITIDGLTPPPADYSIQWFAGPDTSSPTIPGGLIVSNLSPGMYTVEVTNTQFINTQCTSTATFQVFDNPPVISIASGDIQITHVTRCDFSDASATITSITENGVAGNLADYSFEWFFSTLDPMLPNATSKNNLAPGTYYVQATNIINNCASTLLEFEIQDMTPGSVGVDLISFTEPTQCLKPVNLTGELEVLATGNSGSGYTYNWYAGASASGPVVHNTNNFTGITIPGGQADITYTVEVINNDNQCVMTDTYTLPLVISPINITAATAPLTSCALDDGSAFATVTTPSPNEYNYLWYIGNTTKPVTDFPAVPQPAKLITGLPFGEYTVVAVDMMDAACTTQPVTVMVENMQEFPVVTATSLAPVTNCDPARPNGVASALVDGNFIDHVFEWFAGPTDTGVPFFNGSDVGNLSAGEYTVRATNLVSGCSGTASVTIEFSPAAVPAVEVEVLSNVTSCVAPNGSLSASVGGNTADYIFNWYIGSVVKPTADYTGEIISDLAAGPYTVTATSKITGCVSAPVTTDIIEELGYPDFDFEIQNSACSQDGNGDGLPDDRPSGLVTLVPKNNVDMVSIEWVDQQGNTYSGAILAEVEAGIYTVTATSSMGCSTTKEVMIKTDIRPYNGISRNGDNKNYLFHINCISDFPDNIVKIFNRAGTLVYEAEGYDNIDIFFDGRANKGISPMGNNLPDGTYFYVIDKRDGTKPLAGYLEIIN